MLKFSQAYTSDMGEAFRPVVPSWVVRSAYGISWAYVLGDVCWEGKKDYDRGSDTTQLTRTVVKRTIFQSLASMALPAVTIHQTGTKIIFHNQNNNWFTYLPTLTS